VLKSNLKELYRNLDDYYLGLTRVGQGTEASLELEALEKTEAEAEKAMRDERAGYLLQEKFMTKKRRRIEMMQTRDKEVHFSDLGIDQFRELLSKGDYTKGEGNRPNMRESLLKDADAAPEVTMGVESTLNETMKMPAELKVQGQHSSSTGAQNQD
jgi:hypothetical protein